MAREEENITKKMTRQSHKKMDEQLDCMDTSRLSSWRWVNPSFEEGEAWLMAHPKYIKKGIYLSDTPSKEVWRLPIPRGLGGINIIYKKYQCLQNSIWERFQRSLAVNEALNFAALKEIGVPVAEVLACGETRHVGLLLEAYIVTKCIDNTYDGSVLTPSGSLWERTRLRMGFARNAMEHIAKIHLVGCYHSAFRAHKILFPKDCDENNPSLTWIDVANCQFFPEIPMKLAIPKDLVHMFVDLRLSADEIKELENHYLKFNPNCGYTVKTLWNAMVALKN